MLVVFVAAVAAVVGVLAWLVLGQSDRHPKDGGKARPARAIREVPAGKAIRPQSDGDVSVATMAKQESGRPLAESVQSDASPREETKPVTTNAEALAQLEKFKHEPVRGLAEQLLVMVAPLKKGDFMPPAPIGEFSEELEREAEAMLERVGQVEEWDDENSIGIKERLETLKDEWYAAKQKGMSFRAFLLSRQDAAEHDANVLDEARRFDEENFNDASISDSDYLKMRKKVDNLLKISGFDGLPSREDPFSEAESVAPDAAVPPGEKSPPVDGKAQDDETVPKGAAAKAREAEAPETGRETSSDGGQQGENASNHTDGDEVKQGDEAQK